MATLNNNRESSTAFLCLILLVALLLPVFPSVAQELRSETLVVGYVTDNPKKQHQKFKPMADYIVAGMSDLGINRAEIKMVLTMDEMISLLKQGEVDWVSESPFGAVRFMEDAVAEPMLIRVKNDNPEYSSLVFVRKDSDIHSLEDLRGKKVAFEDEGSTSAYFIPRIEILQNGLELQYLSGPRQNPDKDKVGYLFSGAEQNTAAWVYRRIADAGAVSSADWDKSSHIPAYQKAEYRILYLSEPYPRAIELVRSDLSEKIKNRLKTLLINSTENSHAAYALGQFHKTTNFIPLSQSHLEKLNSLRDHLGEE